MSAPLPKLEQYTCKDQCPSCESILHVKSYVSYSALSVHALLDYYSKRLEFIYEHLGEDKSIDALKHLMEQLREVQNNE